MKNSVNKIIKSNRCFKCGMCKSVCPFDAISVNANEKTGFYDIKIDPALCKNCSKCLKTCPANNVQPKSTGAPLGNYRELFLAHSLNDNVRTMATSGGAVNSLVRYMIDKDIVDSVLMIREDIDSAFDLRSVKITKDNCDALLNAPRKFASRYTSYPLLSELKKENGERMAVVGTPCQIKAVRELDVFKIGIACSGAISYNATKIIKNRYAGEDYHIYYRGKGWSGYNSLEKDGTVIETKHLGSNFEKLFSSQIFKNPACCSCDDHFAKDADISFFDFWNSEEMKKEKIGNSAVIIRSEKAEQIFNGAVKEKYIEIQQTISEADAVKTQTLPLLFKEEKIGKKFPLNIYLKAIEKINSSGFYNKLSIKQMQLFSKLFRKILNLTKRIHKIK